MPLGMSTRSIEGNILRMKNLGWSLVSTYVNPIGNPAVREELKDGPIVMGVFETWRKQ
jgi:hypothetical protein